MTTRRADILDQVEANLLTVATIKEIKSGKVVVVDLDTVAFPCAWVFAGPDTRIDGVIGYETWDWVVYVEVWAKDTDMEALLGEIHSAMYIGRKMNGLADNTVRTGSEMFTVDPEQSVEGMLIPFKIEFKHVKGIM